MLHHFDVLYSIFHYLDSLDLIAFGRTCRFIHEAASVRNVWINTVRNVCSENGIFASASWIDSLSVLELQHIATGPSRMLDLLEEKQARTSRRDRRLHLVSQWTLPPPDPSAGRRMTPHSLYLVPGGHFLVMISESYISVMNIEHAQKPLKEYTVSQVFHRGRLMAISPANSGRTLYIILSKQISYVAGNNTALISVWGYDPEANSLTEMASTTRMHTKHLDLTVSCIVGCCLVYFDRHNFTVNIWDFSTDLWSGFKISTDFGVLDDIMYDKGKIIIAGYQCAAIWDFPKPHTQEPSAGKDPLPPLIQLPFNFPMITPRYSFVSVNGMDSHRWDQAVDRDFPLMFDLIHLTGHVAIESKQIRFSPTSSSAISPPEILGVTLTRFDTDHSRYQQKVKQRYCSGAIVRTWLSQMSGTFYFSLPPLWVPMESKSYLSSDDYFMVPSISPVEFPEIRGTPLVDYSFDPLCGRLCYVEQSGYITVVDYLANPIRPSPATVEDDIGDEDVDSDNMSAHSNSSDDH